MPVTALIKFVQGLSTPPAGQALIGVLTTPVTASNGDNSNVEIFEWEVTDRPPTSTVPLGIVAYGTFPSYTFIPDKPGGYGIHLVTIDMAGNQAQDHRVFQVPEESGFLIPPFDAEAPALNFAGQLRGWAKSQEEIIRHLLESGAHLPVVVATTPYAPSLGNNFAIMNAASPLVFDLPNPTAYPTAQIHGYKQLVKLHPSSASTVTITATGAGTTIEAGGTTLVLSTPGKVSQLTYDSVNNTWWIST